MQVGGDARPRGPCARYGGPARGRCVVRARAVGARGAAAAAAARARPHERSGLHGLRQRRLGADWRPVQSPSDRPRRHAEPRRDLRLPAERSRPKSVVRDEDSFAHGAARVSPAGHERRRRRRCSTFFDRRDARGGSFDAGIQFALERMLVDPDFLLRVHRDPAPPRPRDQPAAVVPAERPRARVAAVVLPVEQHPRRAAARPRRARAADDARRCSSSRCGACSPTARPSTRSSTTSPPSG